MEGVQAYATFRFLGGPAVGCARPWHGVCSGDERWLSWDARQQRVLAHQGEGNRHGLLATAGY